MVVADPMRPLPRFSGENTESAEKYLDAFDDYLEIQKHNVVDCNITQIIISVGYSLFGNVKSGVTRERW